MIDRMELLAVITLGFLMDQVPRRSALAVSSGAADRDIYQFSGKRNTEDLRRRGTGAACGRCRPLSFCDGGTTAVVSGGILYACGRISPGLKFLVSVILCYQLFAVRSLKDGEHEGLPELKKMIYRQPGTRSP